MSGTVQVNPNSDSNPNPDEQGARNFAQALLRMLGLQNIVDPSQVNIHTGPGMSAYISIVAKLTSPRCS